MNQSTRKLNLAEPIMSVHDAIHYRRSTRQYVAQAVTEKQVHTLIDAAIHAPSAMNRQPWAFVVIQRPALLKQISDAAKDHLLQISDESHHKEFGHLPLDDPGFDIFYGANTLIVICAKEEVGFSPVGDCYLAAENLMLEAHEMGLATCSVGFARDVLCQPQWKERLSIPAGYHPVLPIVVGYSAHSVPETERAPAKVFAWIT